MLNTVTAVQQWKNWPLLVVLCRPLSYIRHCIEVTQWLHQVLGSYPNIISLPLVSFHYRLWVEFTQNQSGTDFYCSTSWTALLSLALPGLAIMDIRYFGQLSFPGHSIFCLSPHLDLILPKYSWFILTKYAWSILPKYSWSILKTAM